MNYRKYRKLNWEKISKKISKKGKAHAYDYVTALRGPDHSYTDDCANIKMLFQGFLRGKIWGVVVGIYNFENIFNGLSSEKMAESIIKGRNRLVEHHPFNHYIEHVKDGLRAVSCLKGEVKNIADLLWEIAYSLSYAKDLEGMGKHELTEKIQALRELVEKYK